MPPSSTPPPDATFRRRRRTISDGVLVVAVLFLAWVNINADPEGRVGAAIMLLVFGYVLAERLTQTTSVRDGELAVRRHLRRRRVSLHRLTELRADAVLVRHRLPMRVTVTRLHLVDENGRRLAFFPSEVEESGRLTQTVWWWAQHRGLALDPATELLLEAEAAGGLGRMFLGLVKSLWDAHSQSRR